MVEQEDTEETVGGNAIITGNTTVKRMKDNNKDSSSRQESITQEERSTGSGFASDVDFASKPEMISNQVFHQRSSEKENQVVPVTKDEKKAMEKCKSTYSLTKVNAFFVQKTAIQKNSTIDIVFSNIIKEWLEIDVTFSDEEIMDIIDFYAKERSAYIRKTYSVPTQVRELLSRKAGELGIKTTPLINHIITSKRQG